MFQGRHYLWLTALAALMFLSNLGGASLWDLDEGRNAEAAYEMLEAGNWIVPTFNGRLRVDKPALLYWLQIACYQTLGVHEFSARLPSALAALLTILLAYELGRSMFGPAAGLLGGVVAASTPMLCGAARFANPDSLLNLCTVATLTVFWLRRSDPSRLWFAAIGATMGLGVLAKGPVGAVLPAAVIGLDLLWQRRRGLWSDRRWLLAIVTMLVVALPWYIWVAVETRGNFVQGFLLRHNLERFTSPMESHGGNFLYYPLVLLVGLAPWSIFIGPALWYAPWRSGGDAADRDAVRFLACWMIVYVAFFTIAATKLPNYVLPVVVPAALLLARFLNQWRLGLIEPPGWLIGTGLICLVLIGTGVGVGLGVGGGLWPLAALRGRVYPGLESWALLGVVPVLGGLSGFWFWRRRHATGLVVCTALSAILLLFPLAAYGSAFFNAYKAPRPLVDQAGALRRDEIRIGCWNLEHLPSLNFYVRRDVLHLRDEDEAAAFLSYPLPVFLFVPASDWEQLATRVGAPHRIVGRQRDMYRHSEVIVVTNR